MCPLGSLCREHCQGHLPGRLVRPPRILLFIRAAGRRPQSNRDQKSQSVIHFQTQVDAELWLSCANDSVSQEPAWTNVISHDTPPISPCLVHRREILLLLGQDCLGLETKCYKIKLHAYCLPEACYQSQVTQGSPSEEFILSVYSCLIARLLGAQVWSETTLEARTLLILVYLIS